MGWACIACIAWVLVGVFVGADLGILIMCLLRMAARDPPKPGE